jgi:hypothetical protein
MAERDYVESVVSIDRAVYVPRQAVARTEREYPERSLT